MENFLSSDFIAIHNYEMLHGYLNKIIGYYTSKKSGISENKEILLFSLQKIKEFILRSLPLEDFEKFRNIDLSISLIDINEIIHSYIFKSFERHFRCLFEDIMEQSLKWWKNLKFYS